VDHRKRWATNTGRKSERRAKKRPQRLPQTDVTRRKDLHHPRTQRRGAMSRNPHVCRWWKRVRKNRLDKEWFWTSHEASIDGERNPPPHPHEEGETKTSCKRLLFSRRKSTCNRFLPTGIREHGIHSSNPPLLPKKGVITL
jgi:hypothetical protein